MAGLIATLARVTGTSDGAVAESLGPALGASLADEKTRTEGARNAWVAAGPRRPDPRDAGASGACSPCAGVPAGFTFESATTTPPRCGPRLRTEAIRRPPPRPSGRSTSGKPRSGTRRPARSAC